MLLGDKPLIFKVDPLSTGSDALIVGTEEMPPGNKIPTHKHLHEDEVIFVHKGAVRVTLAGREYDAGTGRHFHSAWKLDRRGERFQRACHDSVFL
jgi:oxalate decarboxylase/phosphoglucose isomerase-like protein (cupin superfamily)